MKKYFSLIIVLFCFQIVNKLSAQYISDNSIFTDYLDVAKKSHLSLSDSLANNLWDFTEELHFKNDEFGFESNYSLNTLSLANYHFNDSANKENRQIMDVGDVAKLIFKHKRKKSKKPKKPEKKLNLLI
jgi:hypothetical protein